MLTVYFIRHGQTEENARGIIQGTLDTHLNETGRHQARLCASVLKDVPFVQAYTSSLSRASETARIILTHHSSSSADSIPLEEHPGLMERGMGELSGFQGRIPHPLPKSVEASDVFAKRAMKWYSETILPLAELEGDRTVLVVAHSAFLVTLFRKLVAPLSSSPSNSLNLGYTTHPSIRPHHFNHLANTGISVVVVRSQAEGGGGEVVQYNRHEHLTRREAEVESRDVAAGPQ